MVKQRPSGQPPARGLLRIITHGNALETSGPQHLEDVVEEDHRLAVPAANSVAPMAAMPRGSETPGVELFRQ